MSELHNPAFGLKAFFNQLFFFAARSDMRDETIRNGSLAFADVSCIQTKVFHRRKRSRMYRRRRNSFLQQLIQNHAIIPIGGGYDD